MLYKENSYYISNIKSDTREDPLLVISFTDFLNEDIFHLIPLSTAYLTTELSHGVKHYLTLMSFVRATVEDFNGEIYIYIPRESPLLSKLLEVRAVRGKSFKPISANEWRWM